MILSSLLFVLLPGEVSAQVFLLNEDELTLLGRIGAKCQSKERHWDSGRNLDFEVRRSNWAKSGYIMLALTRRSSSAMFFAYLYCGAGDVGEYR